MSFATSGPLRVSRALSSAMGTGGKAAPSFLTSILFPPRGAGAPPPPPRSKEVGQPSHETPGDLAEGSRRRLPGRHHPPPRPVPIAAEHEADRGRVDGARHHVPEPPDPPPGSPPPFGPLPTPGGGISVRTSWQISSARAWSTSPSTCRAMMRGFLPPTL